MSSTESSNQPRSNGKSTLFLALSCLIAVSLGIYAGVSGFSLFGSKNPPEIQGFLWPEQKQIKPFDLVDQKGEKFDLSGFENEWNLLFFGYTHCPDICPITMSILKQANDQIGKLDAERQKNTRVTFVSVDGERDTPEHLNKYVTFFDKNFRGVTGNKQQVDSLTKQLGIPYEIDAHEPGATDYLVAHSGAILIVTPEGKVASIFQSPHDARPIAENYLAIRTFMEQQG